MGTTLAPPKPKTPPSSGGFGPGGNGFHGGFGGGGDSDAHGREVPAQAYRTGLWMGLAAIVMLFAAFTSALVVRKGMSTDWVSTTLPPVIYLNTIILLASSLTLEISRRSLRSGLDGPLVARFRPWLYATLILGVAFVAGQLLVWRQLASRGVYLATNPSSSFFYLLTAAHGVHLLGGIGALCYLVFRVRGITAAPRRFVSVDLTAIYWHFMDALWIYILLLLMMRL
jgi:cytochrome c oxidase subunit III